MVLFLPFQGAGGDPIDRFFDQVGGEPSQCLGKSFGVVLRPDGYPTDQRNRARIHFAGDPHDRYACFGLPIQESPRDRRGAAVERQQTRMRVDEVTQAREISNRAGQELAEGGDDAEVRLDCFEGVEKFALSDSLGP